MNKRKTERHRDEKTTEKERGQKTKGVRWVHRQICRKRDGTGAERNERDTAVPVGVPAVRKARAQAPVQS